MQACVGRPAGQTTGMRRIALWFVPGLVAFGLRAQDPLPAWLERRAPELEALYRHLHANPELSFHETATAARMAQELRALGLEVTEGVGGTGVVAMLRRGEGPVGLLRADMDALPIAEETGLPYASKVRAESADGRAIGVMHACGHDLHMTCLVGAAGYFAQNAQSFSGTLVFVLQPAEERAGGMKAMLAAGLLTRFPRPAWALALHNSADLPVGVLGLRSGAAMANVETCDITIFGKSGHGALPHLTIDPIVQSCQLVLDLQTIVSREIDPLEACVITVGAIHGGHKHNIVPDSCELQITVRSYTDAVRARMMASIERKAKAVAMSFGAREPKVEFSEHTPAVRNDEVLTSAVRAGFARAFGEGNVREIRPEMIAEDFGRLFAEQIPLCMFRLGTIAPERLASMQQANDVPALHSARYWPDYAPALRVGVKALVTAVQAASSR